MEAAFDELMGQGCFKQVISCLKSDCKVDIGFCSQRINGNKLSASSTAIIIYVLDVLKLLTPEEKTAYTKELLNFQVGGGVYKNAFGLKDDVTTWSTAQACLAMEREESLKNILIEALHWLCDVQLVDGGWSYNGNAGMPSRIQYSLYPLLAIKNSKIKDEKIAKAKKRAYSYVVNYNPQSLFEEILILYLKKHIFGVYEDTDAINSIFHSFRIEAVRGYKTDDVLDSDESHFYISFYLPAYYMFFRLFLSPEDPISLYLIHELWCSLLQGKGWAPKGNDTPYSWTTALGLFTLGFWIKDFNKRGLNMSNIIGRVQKFKKEYILMQTYIGSCPLNGGICNKINEINEDFSENNIFLDIPYCAEYLTFESEIVKTVKRKGLSPLMAKDKIKTKMLLCKVCMLIQESGFGLADISYPTYNIPFELGLLLGLNKKCVILKKKDVMIPSDLQGLEYVEYQNTQELRSQLIKWIKDNK